MYSKKKQIVFSIFLFICYMTISIITISAPEEVSNLILYGSIIIVFFIIILFTALIPNRCLRSIDKIKDFEQKEQKIEEFWEKKNIADYQYYNLKTIAFLDSGEYEQAGINNQLFLESVKQRFPNTKGFSVFTAIYYNNECMISLRMEDFDRLIYILPLLEAVHTSNRPNKSMKDAIHMLRAKLALLDGDLTTAKEHLDTITTAGLLESKSLLQIEYAYLNGDKEIADSIEYIWNQDKSFDPFWSK